MTIGLTMLVSGVLSNPLTATSPVDLVTTQTADVVATTTASTTTSTDIPTPLVKATQNIKTNTGIEKQVRAYFADVPIMAEVARCESRYRQYDKDGSIFRGIVNNKDVGVFQVNEYYHLERSKKLGIDIYSVDGNMRYARILYNESGTAPWVSSSPCWGKSLAKANTTAKAAVEVDTRPIAPRVYVAVSAENL